MKFVLFVEGHTEKQALANLTLSRSKPGKLGHNNSKPDDLSASSRGNNISEHKRLYIAKLKEKIGLLEAELGRKAKQFKRAKTEVTTDQVIEGLQENQILIDFLVFKEVDFVKREYKKNRLMALVELQANELDILKAEINLLRRKGAGVYPNITHANNYV